jgi:hypothetical protein
VPRRSGRLAHAAGLNHGHEDTHVVQLQAALDAIDLVHSAASYNKLDIPSSNKSITSFRIHPPALERRLPMPAAIGSKTLGLALPMTWLADEVTNLHPWHQRERCPKRQRVQLCMPQALAIIASR